MKDKIFWLLFILASIYIIGNIDTGSLTTWDEALYANISANIVKTGDWLVLHDRPGKPWFDKPPLYMWCTVFFYKALGINEFSVRLTSGLFGIATVLLVYIFVKRMNNANAAILAALILLASPHYLHFSKLGMMDVMLTFFITLMIYLFWIGQDKPSYLFWAGIVLLFAYLTKGLAAVAGPFIIFLYCLFSGNLRILIKREFILGICISVVGIFAWHLSQYLLAGPGAVSDYFGFHIFKRATTSLEGHSGGLNFYQKAIFNKNVPWSVLFYASLVYILWLVFKYRGKAEILLVSWTIAVFIIFSMVKTKLHWYIIPIYPALAASSAIFLERFFNKRLFPLILALILLAMLIQVPLSWAFKLDLNPMVKNAALNSIKLPYEDNGTIFYYDTIKKDKQGFI
jgi:4-amino-4-deoxy-L-arabinose transferase-like glycosyltransferase